MERPWTNDECINDEYLTVEHEPAHECGYSSFRHSYLVICSNSIVNHSIFNRKFCSLTLLPPQLRIEPAQHSLQRDSVPLYEFQCKACLHRFEKIQKFSDPMPNECPACGEDAVEQMISAPAVQFKGSGWYVTDYAKKGSSQGSAGKGSESKSETKSDSKTESKPEKKD